MPINRIRRGHSGWRVDLADLTPVTEGLSGKVTPASPLSSGPVVEGRIEVSKLDPNNLPKDGSVGKATEIKTGDAETIEFGEAILVGEVDLATSRLSAKLQMAIPIKSNSAKQFLLAKLTYSRPHACHRRLVWQGDSCIAS